VIFRYGSWFILCSLLLGACATINPAQRQLAQVNPQQFLYNFELDREAGERYRPEDNAASEQKEHQRLIDLFSAHFKNNYNSAEGRAVHQDQNESGHALRGVHAKGHACLSGTFTIENFNVPEYQHSIFRVPKTYQIILRYSNGDGPPHKDSDRKISIGMAFKVLNVKEEKLLGRLQTEDTADFLMTNHPNFIVKDIRDFAEVIEAREGGFLDTLGAVKVAGKGLLQRLRVPKGDPLVTSYWGNLPFKIGNDVVKYLLRPEACAGQTETGEVKVTRAMRKNPDFLSEVLKTHISRHSACFGFYLQRKGNDKESPIEDATVIWPEEGFLTRVGVVEIPTQEPNEELVKLQEFTELSQSGKQICQHLAFSPWNTTKDFKPLSSLNRARRVIYELSTAMRREINRVGNPIEINN